MYTSPLFKFVCLTFVKPFDTFHLFTRAFFAWCILLLFVLVVSCIQQSFTHTHSTDVGPIDGYELTGWRLVFLTLVVNFHEKSPYTIHLLVCTEVGHMSHELLELLAGSGME